MLACFDVQYFENHAIAASVIFTGWQDAAPVAGTGNARVTIPVVNDRVTILGSDGSQSVQTMDRADRTITLQMEGDEKMATGFLVIDRPNH